MISKMPSQLSFWEKAYQLLWEFGSKEMVVDDEWLEKSESLITQYKTDFKAPVVLDLGCGVGNASSFFLKKNYKVFSCDMSRFALEWMKKLLPHSSIVQCDFLGGLPYRSGSFDLIIADSCLHYFSWDETKIIIRELHRVLTSNGSIILRVNSINDTNFGAGQGEQIEKNYYSRDGRLKRFFEEQELRQLFGEMQIIRLMEIETNRFGKTKRQWELIAILE